MPDTAPQSPISRAQEFFARVKNRDKAAIATLLLVVSFVVVFFVGFGYLAARVGPSDDYGVFFHKRLEQTFPAWALHTFSEGSLNSIQCHHCHFRRNEICDAQPLVSYNVAKTNSKGQPVTVVFNNNGALIANKQDHDYIHCEYNVTGNFSDAVIAFYDYGGDYGIELARGGLPESHLIVSLFGNVSTWIGLRHSVVRNVDASEERYWESTTNGFHPLTIEGDYFNIFFEDYTSTIYHQNSKGLDKIDFWQFMGYVGGLTFLFYIMFNGIMAIIGSCCGGGGQSPDRTSYQAL